MNSGRELGDDLDRRRIDGRPLPRPRAAPRRPAPSSSGSSAPPGNAGCPACERSVVARSMSSTSGPSGPSRRASVRLRGDHRTPEAAKRLISSALRPARPQPAGSGSRQGGASARAAGRLGLRRTQETSSTSRRTSFWAISGSTGPSPNEGQSRCDAAGTAGGLAGVADPAAVEDQPVAHDRPLLARDQGGQVGLDLDRILLLGQLHAPREPPDMGVDGDARDPERVTEDDVGGLASDARQFHQLIEPPRHLAAVRSPARPRDPSARALLGRIRAAGGCPPAPSGRPPRRPRRRDSGGTARSGLVHPLVGRLRRQDGGDQQLERGGEVQRAPCVGVHDAQLPDDPPRSPGAGQRRLVRSGTAAAYGAQGIGAFAPTLLWRSLPLRTTRREPRVTMKEKGR